MTEMRLCFLGEDENRADPPQPAEAWWEVSGGERRLYYACPRNPQHACGVPVLPTRHPNGAGWKWDGNEDAPTLSPSINCVSGCGWHGFITSGRITHV